VDSGSDGMIIGGGKFRCVRAMALKSSAEPDIGGWYDDDSYSVFVRLVERSVAVAFVDS